jgi:hypothetical protein
MGRRHLVMGRESPKFAIASRFQVDVDSFQCMSTDMAHATIAIRPDRWTHAAIGVFPSLAGLARQLLPALLLPVLIPYRMDQPRRALRVNAWRIPICTVSPPDLPVQPYPLLRAVFDRPSPRPP